MIETKFHGFTCYVRIHRGYGLMYLNNTKESLPFAVISKRGNIIQDGVQIGTINELTQSI